MRDVPDFIDFDPYPWKSFSYWITTQLVRWNLTSGNLEHEEIADEVFLTGIARQLAKKLGQEQLLVEIIFIQKIVFEKLLFLNAQKIPHLNQ